MNLNESLYEYTKTGKRRRIVKLYNEKPPLRPAVQTTTNQKADYKYFADLFGKENQKAMAKELQKTAVEVKVSKPQSIGEVDFKDAVIRKQELKTEIKVGFQKVATDKKIQILKNNPLPPKAPTIVQDTNIDSSLLI